MSWAAHNPEAYDELTRSAAARWLANQWLQVHGEPSPDVEEDFLPKLVEMLQGEHREVFDAMLKAGAALEVDESEYFDRLVH
jgi:hypothetical protein